MTENKTSDHEASLEELKVEFNGMVASCIPQEIKSEQYQKAKLTVEHISMRSIIFAMAMYFEKGEEVMRSFVLQKTASHAIQGIIDLLSDVLEQDNDEQNNEGE